MSPVSILSILFFIMAFTFGNMFTTSFTVTNLTNETVFITPIGTYKNNPGYLYLPLEYWFYPSFPKLKKSDIIINPKKKKKFYYEADGFSLRGLVINTGQFKKIYIIDNGQNNSDYSINKLNLLPDFSNENRIKGRSKNFLVYLFLLLGLINIYFLTKTNKLRKLGKTAHNK